MERGNTVPIHFVTTRKYQTQGSYKRGIFISQFGSCRAQGEWAVSPLRRDSHHQNGSWVSQRDLAGEATQQLNPVLDPALTVLTRATPHAPVPLILFIEPSRSPKLYIGKFSLSAALGETDISPQPSRGSLGRKGTLKVKQNSGCTPSRDGLVLLLFIQGSVPLSSRQQENNIKC